MSLHDRLLSLVEPIVADLGLELFDLQYTGGTLTVLIQKPAAEREPGAGAGVDVGAITAVTRAVSRALDDADPISGSYALEVSTPGLERPLRTADHFVGALGETVSIKMIPTSDGPRRLKGELLAVADGDLTIRLDDGPADAPGVIVALADIDKARTVFVWGPEPKGPSGPASKAGKKSAKASGTKPATKPATKKVTSS